MADQKLNFTLEKETKNTVRYKEDPPERSAPVVGSLYVQKWYFKGSAPKTISLTLHVNEHPRDRSRSESESDSE